MKYYLVTFTHESYIEAETEADAQAELARDIRDNIEPYECEAEEIPKADYDAHWDYVLARDEANEKHLAEVAEFLAQRKEPAT